MKKISLFSLMLAISMTALSQFINIRGIVKDTDGEALVGANVVVENTLLGVISNSKGEFKLSLDAKKTYKIKVSYMGYDSYVIEATPPFESSYKVVLQSSMFIADEVVVTATRAGNKTPMAYENMEKEEIAAQNMGQDMGYLLSLTPSLVQSSESGTGIGYTNFRIRGADPSRINITVDGIPLNDAESQQVFWVNMPSFSSSLSSIQVQRGVGTSTNGAAAFGATVNMQTATPSREAYAEISSTFGSYNTWINTMKAGTGLIKDRISLDFRYSNMKSDGYVDYAFSDNQSMQFTGTYFTKKGRVKANVILGEQHSGISWWGVDEETLENDRTYNPAGQYLTPSGEQRYYENQTDNYWQNHYHLVYSTNLSDRLLFNAALYYVDGRGYYEQFKQDEELADYYLPEIIIISDTIRSTDLIRQKWLDNDFYGTVFSLIWSGDQLKLSSGGGLNRYVGDHFGELIWMRYAGDAEKEHEWYRNSSEKWDGNLYLKSNYQITNRLNLFADLQYRYVNYLLDGIDDDGYMRELDQEHSFHFFNPKLGAQMEISTTQYAYASFSIGNREPTRQNFKDATGDPESTPRAERLRDLELGYSFSSHRMAAAVNLYYMDYKDQLVPTGELSNDGYPVMTNVEKSYRSGVELSLGIQPFSFLEWNANLTLSRNRIRDFVESYVDYNSTTWEGTATSRSLGDMDIAYSPSVITSGDLVFHLAKSASLHFISQYVSEQYFVNSMNENMKLDAWFVNNLRLDYSFPVRKIGVLGLQFQVNNLFNVLYENNAYGGTWWQDGEEYYWSAYFPQATINCLAKVSLRF
jgi:iron complex outermembrane recepter protein